ncbi:MAG: amidohydrolase [bacterium]|nr:MAG: amidohydrolase [bacterium]
MTWSGGRGGAAAEIKGRARVEAVFYNGKLYTLDAELPRAEAVAVGGGRIVTVGDSRELLATCGPQAQRFDLGQKTVIPGLIDAHAHFMGYAKVKEKVDLVGTKSFTEVLDRLTDRLRSAGEGAWIVGRGWDQNDWPDPHFPGKGALDSLAPNNPVFLVRVCGHAAVANSEALRLAGITGTTIDPGGGKIVRDGNGVPTGLLIDNAIDLVSDAVPTLTRQQKRLLIRQAARECLSTGLVGVHEMGVGSETISIYRELFDREELPFRLTLYFSNDEEDLDSLLAAGPLRGYADNRLSVVGVKFYADGSLGARSAALLEDYSDDPGNRGIVVEDPETLYRRIMRCHRKGFQTATHAIGDGGNRMMLDILERILAEYPASDMRHRVEHAQVIAPEDIGRFARLGVLPSMQFTHCTSDMPWAGARLGEQRLAGAYAWRSLVSSGCRIPGGSDFPVESIDPLLGIYAAVTRMDRGGSPPGGWIPDQCLTVDEAVRAFSIDAAYAAHEEDLRGTITPGKLADFIVLSEDIMRIEPERIPDIRVLATILGGEIVFEAPDAPFGRNR